MLAWTLPLISAQLLSSLEVPQLESAVAVRSYEVLAVKNLGEERRRGEATHQQRGVLFFEVRVVNAFGCGDESLLALRIHCYGIDAELQVHLAEIGHADVL